MPKKVKPVSLKGIVKAINDVNKQLTAAKKLVDAEDKPLLDAKIKKLKEIKGEVMEECRHLSVLPV